MLYGKVDSVADFFLAQIVPDSLYIINVLYTSITRHHVIIKMHAVYSNM